ncbi:MAG TPA: HAD-IA family hydrolase [Candidatus Angelobacter sp.]|jgi:pyrophosphatase PpaX|nr:HAD-IA family hydrolase [Candidatus Angelobacter sp.]
MSALPTSLPSSAAAPVDAVVWDYDGTLVATRFADEAAVAELIRRDPAAAAGAEVFWATEGQPIIQRLELAWPGRAAEVLPLFDQRVRPHLHRGVTPVLEELRRRGYPMAVVSSRRREPLEWGLTACGLRPYFSVVVGLEDVATPKPDPEGLLKAVRRLRVAPSRAVYVGDSEVDVEAGHRAGMTAWRATWAAPPEHAGSRVSFLLMRPGEVLDRLDGLAAAAGE